MKKNIAVIGIGRFGFALVKTLSTLKTEVLTIDTNEEVLQKVSKYSDREALCDSTKIDGLKDLDIQNYDTVVVAIGNNMHATIMTTINLVELKVPRIVVRVDQAEYVPVLTKLGAHKVIVPEEQSAISYAHQLASLNFSDYYDIQGDFGIVQMKCGSTFIAKTLIDLDSRNKYNVNIVGIIRNGKFFIPKGTDTVEPQDDLLVVGADVDLDRFSKSLHS